MAALDGMSIDRNPSERVFGLSSINNERYHAKAQMHCAKIINLLIILQQFNSSFRFQSTLKLESKFFIIS